MSFAKPRPGESGVLEYDTAVECAAAAERLPALRPDVLVKRVDDHWVAWKDRRAVTTEPAVRNEEDERLFAQVDALRAVSKSHSPKLALAKVRGGRVEMIEATYSVCQSTWYSLRPRFAEHSFELEWDRETDPTHVYVTYTGEPDVPQT